jgi:glycosyltransferase involved in cell wall biosynthesis
MKILTLNYEFPPVGGGASQVSYQLCKHLAALGHHVDVVTMRYGHSPAFESVDGINIYRTPALRKRPDICRTHEMATYLLGATWKTFRLAREKKYDVIHCHFIIPTGPLAWLLSKLTSIPFLITCHGTDVPGHNPDRFTTMHKLLLPLWRRLVRQTPLLISPSKSLASLIKKHVPQANIAIVPNGIDTEHFTPSAKEQNILMCSRVLPHKGFQYALEAIKQLNTNWQVNLIGDGPYLPQLKHIAQQLNLPVNFWGWLDKNDPQFKKLYETSSIFIFTSEAENFPTVLLEAMSAGLAIITTTAGGCPEVVGDAALLVEPQDVNSLRQQLKRLIDSEDLRRQLSSVAQQRVQNFSWPNIARQYINYYQQISLK